MHRQFANLSLVPFDSGNRQTMSWSSLFDSSEREFDDERRSLAEITHWSKTRMAGDCNAVTDPRSEAAGASSVVAGRGSGLVAADPGTINRRSVLVDAPAVAAAHRPD